MSIITITNENTINPDMSEEYVKEFIEKIRWIEE
jgi:hypothetical protein